MKLAVVAVGRLREPALRTLWQDYARRLTPPPELVEIEIRGNPPDFKTREGTALLAALDSRARVVALDGRGRTLDSEGLARTLEGWADGGVADAAFVIGGADGLDPRVLARADLTLSFGAMTWPHQLVRVMLIEQLYRADSIRRGHPYHRA